MMLKPISAQAEHVTISRFRLNTSAVAQRSNHINVRVLGGDYCLKGLVALSSAPSAKTLSCESTSDDLHLLLLIHNLNHLSWLTQFFKQLLDALGGTPVSLNLAFPTVGDRVFD